jgi:DNA polymerase-3 subunit epsilon
MKKPQITLERPIIFFDLETTGLEKKSDRIVQIGLLKYDTDWTLKKKVDQLINPGIPIPPVVSEIHGITDDMVKDSPTFDDFGGIVYSMMTGCDIAGFNSNRFDIPFLAEELSRVGFDFDFSACNLVDVGNMYKILKPRTLIAAAQEYCNVDLKDAHNAMVDTQATADVFFAQLEQHGEIPKSIAEIALYSNYGKPMLDLAGKFTTNEGGDVIFNFGGKKGEKASDNKNYLSWMMSADFDYDTKRICQNILAQ